jgi:hypothetical protein
MIAITDFILKFPLGYTQRNVPAYIYNAVAQQFVDKQYSQKKGHLSVQSNECLIHSNRNEQFYKPANSLTLANSANSGF